MRQSFCTDNIMKKGKVYIGTSGWHYKHWKGTFYPGKIKNEEQFDFYKNIFASVEINNSFYRLPSLKTFNEWHRSAPPHFVFAVKASRYFTHIKKLNIKKGDLRKFFTRIQHLENTLGPILFQLPPTWKINEERFENFLSQLPAGFCYAFEFRNETWYDHRIYDLLRKYDCAFCIYQLAGHLSPLQITSSFVYIRLHGPTENKYQGSYSAKQLERWSNKCRQWQDEGKDVYIYFDNDQNGYAAFNAQKLMKLVG